MLLKSPRFKKRDHNLKKKEFEELNVVHGGDSAVRECCTVALRGSYGEEW